MLPTVRQTLQAMSSLKTNGVAASSIQIVPPMTVAIRTPNAVASALPMIGIATNEEPDSPQQHRREQPGQQPGQEHVRRGELAVQTAGDQAGWACE